MTLAANAQGLHDLGGNVWEWIDAWWNETKKERVLRGGSFYDHDRRYLLSSYRSPVSPVSRLSHVGFRCVMVMK